MLAELEDEKYVDTKTVAQLGDTIVLPLPSPVGKKNIRNLPLLKELQSLCTCWDRIRSQHQHSIDIEGEGIIQFWFATKQASFPILMNGANGVSTISAVMEGNTVEISLWREMRLPLEVV